MKKHLANGLTLARIFLSLLLMICPLFSFSFNCIYILCGATDMADGPIARATGTASAAGALLDSLADLVFALVLLLRLGPFLWDVLPLWVWLAALVIALLRCVSCWVRFRKCHHFVLLHTVGNKLTGLLLFAFPLLLQWPGLCLACLLACGAAFLSAAEELIISLRSPQPDPNIPSLFHK